MGAAFFTHSFFTHSFFTHPFFTHPSVGQALTTRELAIRALGLYVPAVLTTVVGWQCVRTHRQIAAMLAGFCWALNALLTLQFLNLHFNWWAFHAQGGLFRSMPTDLYLGWALLWGVLPVLCFPASRVWMVILGFIALDLGLMPNCAPVVRLSGNWLTGEVVAAALVLLPATLFARWSWDSSCLNLRATFWAITAMSSLLFLIPEIIFAGSGVAGIRNGGWGPLVGASTISLNAQLQFMFLLAVPAISAAQEFARRGLGTPIPFDPPGKLVVSGLYRYVANPMQVSGALVLMAWGAVLRNPWLIAAGPFVVIYSLGLAAWHEKEEMPRRFGKAWWLYRRNVKNWNLRWRPWHDPHRPIPRLYIAESCGPCSEVRRWFEAHDPMSLEIVAAEDHPSRNLTRMTYDPLDGTPAEDGVAAFARGLEHLHLGWTYIGACLRLPVIRPLVQALMDAAGFGPQTVMRRECAIPQHKIVS